MSKKFPYLSKETYTEMYNSGKDSFKVSFDFDNTLDTEQMQSLCEKYMKLGAEVFVTTSRARIVNKKEVDHSDLFEVTDRLGIDRKNITFTGYQDKYSFLDKMDIHYDDSIEEIFLINECPNKCIGFLYEEKHNNGIVNF